VALVVGREVVSFGIGSALEFGQLWNWVSFGPLEYMDLSWAGVAGEGLASGI